MVRKKNSGAVTDEAVSIDSIYHCCKRCARKRQTRYLPQDIVFQFLLHLPAQLLHDVVRHVCREWSLIIRSPNFAHHHYRNSTGGGVMIQAPAWPHEGFYLEMRRGRLEISKFDCGLYGTAGTSCNGLMVISDRRSRYDTTYLTNPLTKKFTILPRFFPVRSTHYQDCGLAFVEAFMVYKLARAIGDGNCLDPVTQIAVLTIGVDRVWRHIDIRHLLLLPSEEIRFRGFPLVTGGYMHWPGRTFVLTLDVESEIVRRFSPAPLPEFNGTFLAMGSNLSFIHVFSEFFNDVWEMNSVSGEWTMLFRIDKERIIDRFYGMFTRPEKLLVGPACWLTAREIVIYGFGCGRRSGAAYNVKTGEIQTFEWEGRG